MAANDWRTLFPGDLAASNPSEKWPGNFTVPAESDNGELWTQIAKAVDPRYEKPQARPGVNVEVLPGEAGAILSYDEGAKEGAYVQLTPQDLYLWEWMDGTRSQIDLVVEYCLKYKTLASTRVAALVEALRAQKMLTDPADELYLKLSTYLKGRTFSGVVNNIMQSFFQKEFSVGGIDNLLGRLYRGGVWVLYTKPVQIICWVIALSGLVAYLLLLNSGRFSVLGDGALGALTLLFFQIIALFQHEMGHAFTVKFFKRKVRRAGLLLLYGLPGAFVDTSDIWPAGRKAQLWVTWAGPFTNLVTGGAVALLAALNLDSPFAPLLFQIALSHYVLVILNITPFLRLDGYYLLADWLQIVNLRPRSFGFLRFGLPPLIRQGWKEGRLLPRLSREQVILGLFGAVSMLWLINLLALAVITAPIRVIDTLGLFISGTALKNPVTSFFLLLGLVFTLLLLIRGTGFIRRGLSKLGQNALKVAAWRTMLVFGLIALIIALIPTFLSFQDRRASNIYSHGLALATDGLIMLFALRMVKELYGAPLRRGLLGMFTTGVVLGLIDLYAALQALLPAALPELPRWIWLIGILPAMLVSAPAARTMADMRRADVGLTLIVGQVATYSLVAAAFLPLDARWGGLLILMGHTFYLSGLTLHWNLAHRPMLANRAALVTNSNSEDKDGLLGAAVAQIIVEQLKGFGEIAGRTALVELAKAFNRHAAFADWPIWITLENRLGDQTSGPIEQRAAIYRAALNELQRRISDTLGAAFAHDLHTQALIELPRPLRLAFHRSLTLTRDSASPIQNSKFAPPGWSSTKIQNSAVDDDRLRVRLAGRRIAETLVIGCARTYGWLLTERALAGFNRTAAIANWSLYIRAKGRLTDELEGDVLSIAHTYADALQDLLGRIAEISGVRFIERGLIEVYDNLPWEVREVATTLLFARLSWAQNLGLAEKSKDDPHLTFLRNVPLLSWLAPNDLAEVAERLTSRKIRRGREIVGANSYLNHAWVVRNGSVQVVQTSGGVQQVIEQLGSGSIIGLRSLLEDQPVPYQYLAQTDLELWLVPREVVIEQLAPLLHLQGALDEERAKLALLGRIPLFATLATAQRTALAQSLEVREYSPSSVILQAGEESQGFFIIREGELEVLIPTADGGEQAVSTLGKGEFFGESALLNRGKVTATIRARGKAELLRLPPADFYTLLADSLAAPLAQVESRRANERARMTQMV